MHKVRKKMNGNQTIYLAGGCFWCTEAVFSKVKGVLEVHSGYAGGFVKNPCYREVCNGTTGHAECVEVVFDTSIISLDIILAIFFATHDPTTLNRQGYDVGTQYRSAIFFTENGQKEMVDSFIKRLEEKAVFDSKIVTQIKSFEAFYKAEPEHHQYYERNSNERYCSIVISPKLNHLKEQFSSYLLS